MKNGLYRIEFGVGGNVGSGVITYIDGQVSGGDGGFAYLGHLNDAGGKLKGKVDVFQHMPGYPNVFAGLTDFTLDIEGQQMTEDTAGFHGTTASAPGQAVKVSIQLLRAL